MFKDVVPEPLHSCQIYNFTGRSCNASYIGKTFRCMNVRDLEHQGVSPRTDKYLATSMGDPMLDYNHIVSWDDFKVLGRESNHWLLVIKESYLLKEIDLHLIRIFTPKNCFCFSFTMSFTKCDRFYLLLLHTLFVNSVVC